MNEPRKAGRPRKHLENEHHFRTSDDATTADASPVDAESDQADAIVDFTEPPSVSAEPIEDVVEIPITHHVGMEVDRSKDDVYKEEVVATYHYIEPENLNGWHPIDTEIVMEMPPRNGMPVRLSINNDSEGVLAVWKKTRKFANATHRWQESGKWIDFNTGLDISFAPKYWKERF